MESNGDWDAFQEYVEERYGLSREDEELVEKLRHKYGGAHKAPADATSAEYASGAIENDAKVSEPKCNAALGPSTFQPTVQPDDKRRGNASSGSASISFTVCPSCQGSGRHSEVYNFRVLESDCQCCKGECIVTTAYGAKVFNSPTSPLGKENSAQGGSSAAGCICGRCRKPGPEDQMFCCGRCKSTVYCGKDCQVKDWSNHRLICTKATS